MAKKILDLITEPVTKWECEGCGNLQNNNTYCTKCNRPAVTFREKNIKLEQGKKEKYEILENIIYGLNHLEKGLIVTFEDNNPDLPNLIKRKCIQKVV